MAMTTEQIESIIDKQSTLKGDSNSEAVEPSKESQSESEKAEQQTDAKVDEKPTIDKKSEQKNKRTDYRATYTHEERVNYAFAKEKSKRRAMKAEYEARIADLEKALADKKSKADFGDDVDKYIDYKLATAEKNNELSKMKASLRNTEQADIDAENNRRVESCFADETERAEYTQLLNERGPQFLEALQKFDSDGVVLDWLDSKEDYPRVLKALMTDKEALKSVFSHPDSAGRLIALDRLRNKLNGQVKKPHLPKLGRLTKSSDQAAQTKSIEYWNNYLKTHPRGR